MYSLTQRVSAENAKPEQHAWHLLQVDSLSDLLLHGLNDPEAGPRHHNTTPIHAKLRESAYFGWQWPVFVAPMPHVKSKYVLPVILSLTHEPLAHSVAIFVWHAGGHHDNAKNIAGSTRNIQRREKTCAKHPSHPPCVNLRAQSGSRTLLRPARPSRLAQQQWCDTVWGAGGRQAAWRRAGELAQNGGA